MDYEDSLTEQVHAVSHPIYADTKADLVRYYAKEYPNRWQTQLAQDLAQFSNSSANSIKRRFNPDRIHRPGSAMEQVEYQELGEQIGPVEYDPPADGYEITFVGKIRISKECYPRAFTIYIAGGDAWDFANNVDGMTPIQAYFALSGQEDVPEDWCDEPDVEVRAA